MHILYHFCILQDYTRLDSALQHSLNITRSQASQWIQSGLVCIDGAPIKKGKGVKKKSCITIHAHTTPKELESQNAQKLRDLHIEVIHETDDYVIFNKPRDLVIHYAPSVQSPTLTDYLQLHNYELSTINGELRFGIVHRLDKDTSGAILVAKNNASHLRFAQMLSNRTMGRIYICVIQTPLQENTIVECYMGRNPNNRIKMAKLDKERFPQARDSKSEFRKIMQSKNGKFELIGVRLFSGRTHQIRVHLSTLQRYIYGDTLYSPENLKDTYTTKMLLHAQLLYFEGVVFSAKLPKDLVKFLEENFIDYQNQLESVLSQWQQELYNEYATM